MTPVSFLVLVCRAVLGGLFVWASFTKLTDLHAFAEELANYQLLPARVVPWIASTLPGIELVCGLALVAGVRARAASLVVAGMLVVFIAGLSQALVRGIDLRCGCFGGSDAATWGTVWRDVAMLLAAVPVAWKGPGPFALDRGPSTGGN